MGGQGGSSDNFGTSESTPFVMTTYNPQKPYDDFIAPGVDYTYGFEDDLSTLFGTDPAGDWSLIFYDSYSSDQGTLKYA